MQIFSVFFVSYSILITAKFVMDVMPMHVALHKYAMYGKISTQMLIECNYIGLSAI